MLSDSPPFKASEMLASSPTRLCPGIIHLSTATPRPAPSRLKEHRTRVLEDVENDVCQAEYS
jgi:hypothetical protein